MNRYQINGESLGTSASSVFSQTSGSCAVDSTGGATTVYVIHHISETLTCAATSVSTWKAVVQFAAGVTATASSVIAVTNYVAKYLAASILASATAVVSFLRVQPASGAVSATASHQDNFIKAIVWAANLVCGASAVAPGWVYYATSSSVTATATSTFNWDVTGIPASPDRIMVVPSEDRTMVVT